MSKNHNYVLTPPAYSNQVETLVSNSVAKKVNALNAVISSSSNQAKAVVRDSSKKVKASLSPLYIGQVRALVSKNHNYVLTPPNYSNQLQIKAAVSIDSKKVDVIVLPGSRNQLQTKATMPVVAKKTIATLKPVDSAIYLDVCNEMTSCKTVPVEETKKELDPVNMAIELFEKAFTTVMGKNARWTRNV